MQEGTLCMLTQCLRDHFSCLLKIENAASATRIHIDDTTHVMAYDPDGSGKVAIGNRTQFRVDGAWAVNYTATMLNECSQMQDLVLDETADFFIIDFVYRVSSSLDKGERLYSWRWLVFCG